MLRRQADLLRFKVFLARLHQTFWQCREILVALGQFAIHGSLFGDFGQLSLDLLLLLVRVGVLGPVWNRQVLIDAFLSSLRGQLRGLVVGLSLLLDLLESFGVEFGTLLRFQGNSLMSELLTGKILLSKSVHGLFGSRDRRRLTSISLLVVLLLLTEHELIVRH